MKKIVILASGSGSNAEAIMAFFAKSETAKIVLLASNKVKAGAFDKARKYGIPVAHITRDSFYDSELFLDQLRDLEPHAIVLAGFLWKVPENIIAAFPNKILNIHPALLPKYGGKGMYGMHVHRSVIEGGESESGLTIHLVNAQYDKGAIIFQASVAIESDDTPESLQQKVLRMEHKYYPSVLDTFLHADPIQAK